MSGTSLPEGFQLPTGMTTSQFEQGKEEFIRSRNEAFAKMTPAQREQFKQEALRGTPGAEPTPARFPWKLVAEYNAPSPSAPVQQATQYENVISRSVYTGFHPHFRQIPPKAKLMLGVVVASIFATWAIEKPIFRLFSVPKNE